MMTFDSNKTSSTMNNHQEMYSLRKSKDSFDTYTKTWDKEKMKKIKFPSILDHISQYRSKVELLQNNTLAEQKLHTQDKVWVDTLRTDKNVENYYNDKFVQKVISDTQGFCLKGSDKLQKEMQWID